MTRTENPVLDDPAAILISSRLMLLHAATSLCTPLQITGQRRSEVAGMRSSELNLDEGNWELPANRVKNARLHIVPLPDQSVEILRCLHSFLASDFVFTTTGRSPRSALKRKRQELTSLKYSDYPHEYPYINADDNGKANFRSGTQKCRFIRTAVLAPNLA